MRIVGAVILSAALVGTLAVPAGAGELLAPGRPAGLRAAQETSFRWVYISGGTVMVAGVAMLISNSSSVSTVLKIGSERDRIAPVIVVDSTVSTGS